MNADPGKAKSIFLEALDLAAEEERRAYLAAACGGDEALRREVEELLRHEQELGSFLEASPGGVTTCEESAAPAVAGSVVGPYKLLEQIGEGGFGVVFMAEQQEPIRRKVALKVLKPGMDTRQVIARFEQERQALALMDHPNIAKVLDAGATASGRPYFVMELVKGAAVTAFCDEHRLTLRERLDLFLSVCQAVQHAHQKGIIHRDLKPSNVLVTLHDGKPVVKVIDFGIAKATGPQLTAKTLFTGFAQMVGTPLYMSPEQARLSGLDVDTRSDVYSLGVLLYELLTGSTPFTKERLRQAGYDEMRRIIREEEPPRPSTRISTLGRAATTVSGQRRSDPKRLSQLFRGELDWIVMKALEKDRNRRYESASAFAADVQRYLSDEPVQACPPSAGYRVRKFVRRHKGPVLGAGVVLFLLTAGIAGTTTGLARALSERDQKDAALRQGITERDAKEEARREAVTERDKKEEARKQTAKERDQKEEARRKAWRAFKMLTHDVVEELLGRQVQLADRHREFLKKVLAEHAALAAANADDPEGRQNEAEGLFLVGLIRHRLGETREAEAAYREAAALQKKLADEFPGRPEFRYDLGLTYNNLGALLNDTGRPGAAEAAYGEALALRKQLAAEFPDRPEYRHELAQSHNNLGNLLSHTGRPNDAEAAYRDALAISKQLAADFPERPEYREDVALSDNSLAILYYHTGRPKEAEAAWRDAVAIRKQLNDDFPAVPDHQHDLAVALMNLGNLLRDTERLKEAEADYGEALAISKQLAADFPNRPDFRSGLATTEYNLAIVLHKTGRTRDADASLRDALALQKQLAADFPNRTDFRHDLAKAYTGLGVLWRDTGRAEETEAASRDAVALLKKLADDLPDQSEVRQDLALGYNNLGTLLRNTGQLEKAEAAYNDAVVIQKKLATDFPDRPDYRSQLAGSYYNLGVLLHLTHRPKEAEAAWRDSLKLREQLTVDFPKVPDIENDVAATLTSLATLLRVTDRPKEAEEAYGKALAIGKRLTAEFPDRPAFREGLGLTYNNLGVLLSGLHRPEEAESAYRDAAALWKKLADDFPAQPFYRQESARTFNNLGVVLVGLRRAKEAEAAYRDAAALWKQLADDFPTQPAFRQESARTYDNLSGLLRATRRPEEAESAWCEALAARKKLVADFPNVPDYQNELAGNLVNLAMLHRNRFDFDAGLALLKEAKPHHEAALKAKPDDPTYRHFYRNHLLHLTGCQLGLNNFAQAAAAAEELARFGYDPAYDNYEAARFLSACAIGVGMNSQLDEAKRKELVQSYGDQSLARLQEAVARGFKDAARIKQDPAFQPIREREEFKKLLAELEEKAKK
jgi:serine/threonine protein kinase/tetratricopeptide (TPR) repeat protein